jgi:hypothetical protein
MARQALFRALPKAKIPRRIPHPIPPSDLDGPGRPDRGGRRLAGPYVELARPLENLPRDGGKAGFWREVLCVRQKPASLWTPTGLNPERGASKNMGKAA